MGDVRCWYRLHANGWIAMVRITADDKITYASHPVRTKAYGFRPASDVESAQRSADAQVPPHDCGNRCGLWFEGLPRDR